MTILKPTEKANHEIKDVERLYELSLHQSSELHFLSDEVRFLKYILESQLPVFTHEKKHMRIQLIASHVVQLKLVKNNVIVDHLTHQGNLNAYIKGSLIKSPEFYQLESDRIQEEVNYISKLLKNIKRELFAVFKDISCLDSSKN